MSAFRLLLLLGAFLAAPASAQTIDATVGWDGSERVNSIGEDATTTYGQTFTAIAAPLQEWTFYAARNPESTSPLRLMFHVMAWNTDRASGPSLFSALASPLAGDGFHPLTFNLGGLALTPGAEYVAILTAVGAEDGTPDHGRVAMQRTDVYTGGHFVYQNTTLGVPSELTVNGWTTDYGDGRGDLGFVAVFGGAAAAVPEPASTGLMLSGLVALGWNRRRARGSRSPRPSVSGL